MYNLQINNRFLHLDYDDENEENVENKKTVVESKKNENKKEPVKKTKNNAAVVVPTNTVNVSEKSKDSNARSNQGKPLANTQPAQEKAAVAQIDDNRRNQLPRQNNFSSNNFSRGGPAGGGGGNMGQFGSNRPPARPPSGGNFGGDNRGAKREFERKSGSEKTGVRANDKRDGAGPHNWGNSIKDFTTETFAPPADAPDAETEEKKGGDEKSGEVKEGGNIEGGNAEEQEPVQPVMSLEEYFSKLEREKSGKPGFQLRKPGEGEGSFASVKLGKKIQKQKDPNDEMVRIIEEKGSGRVKNVIEINIPSMANRGGGRGRGGRGGRGGQNNYGDRSGGGGPGGRGDYGGHGYGHGHGQNNQPIALDDESSFPALAQ